jgi:RNA polymerase sigma-70 factor (ECF subfamily)
MANTGPLTAVASEASPPPGQDWEQIAESHYPRVLRHAYRLTGNRSDAEDLAQETFIRVFRSLETYDPTGNFEAWLHRITTNLFLDSRRRAARVRMEELGDDAGEIEATEASPEFIAEAVSANAAISTTLGRLTPQLREALIMCDVEGRSYKEIAEQLGIPPGTVRSRLHRARAQAREAFGDMAGTPSQ